MADEAYLNGILLDCETITDGFDKAVAVHEIPFSDRAVLQDLGLKARAVRLRCYFYNDRYADHYRLLDQLKNRRPLELEHPDYGLLSGMAKSVNVRHDDRKQTAEIDLEFVAGPETAAPRTIKVVRAEAEAFYEAGLAEAAEAFGRDVRGLLGEDALSVLETDLDPDTDVLDQFSGLSNAARNLVRKVDAKVRALEAFMATVATPANALISTLHFATDLPGRVIGSMALAASRYSTLLSTLAGAPQRFLQSFQDGMDELFDALFPDGTDDGSQTLPVFLAVVALEAGLQAGYGFDADEHNRRMQKAGEGAVSFDVLGNYTPAPELSPVMDVREIESALALAREMIRSAVEQNRQNQALKNLAAALLSHVTAVKLELEKIVSIELSGPTPLHLVCLQYGLPYQAAARILAINSIPHPNFAFGSIDIYVQ